MYMLMLSFYLNVVSPENQVIIESSFKTKEMCTKILKESTEFLQAIPEIKTIRAKCVKK